MKQHLKLLLICTLALLVLWGSFSWYLSQKSEAAFHDYVAALNAHSREPFFDVAVDDYKETLIGAEALLTVNFSIPSFKALFGELKLIARRVNGPLFINEEGIQFGSVRWVVSVNQDADVVVSNTIVSLFNGEIPQAVIRLDFSNQAHYHFVAKHFHSRDLRADEILLTGHFDLSNGAYDLGFSIQNSRLSWGGTSVRIPEVDIAAQRLTQNPDLDGRSNAAIIDIIANKAMLQFSEQGKKIPLDLSSRGSLWLINDTLSGDWQMLFKSNPNETARQLRIDLQFRELIADGFLDYWRQQAKIANLYEQAEWALEEGAETPEEQDFIMSLYGDADRIKQSSSRDVFRPMLKYDHSQLVLNARLKDDVGELGHIAFEAGTKGSKQNPQLALSGDAGVVRDVLTEAGQTLLERWYQRFWLRRYEAAFEADIAVRHQQFLLNNIRVSWEDLSSELKQLLTDQ